MNGSRTGAPLPLAAFLSRLRDLLGTVEAAALLGVTDQRVRGLGEHLRFACLAVQCDVAYVALELEDLGRLRVPAVATRLGYRATSADFMPSGTPFAFLLGGGGGHVAELAASDSVLEPITPDLRALARDGLLVVGAGEAYEARSGVFVPVRLGDSVVGGAALLASEPLGDAALEMAERLAEVLALTIEAFRTERLLFELFARALPDVLGGQAATSLPSATARALREMRVEPAYRRRLSLAVTLGRLAERGPLEARLAEDLIGVINSYIDGGAVGELGGDGA